MKIFNRYNSFLIIFILFHSIGYSYIDPGSLNAIWQFLAAILIGIATGFSFIRIKLKEFYYKLFNKHNHENTSDDKNKTKVDSWLYKFYSIK